MISPNIFHTYHSMLESIDLCYVDCIEMVMFDGQSYVDLTSLVSGHVQYIEPRIESTPWNRSESI